MKTKHLNIMKSDLKLTETGTLPYHLNNDSTAKNFSDMKTTCPEDNLIFVLSQADIIEDNITIIDNIVLLEQ